MLCSTIHHRKLNRQKHFYWNRPQGPIQHLHHFLTRFHPTHSRNPLSNHQIIVQNYQDCLQIMNQLMVRYH